MATDKSPVGEGRWVCSELTEEGPGRLSIHPCRRLPVFGSFHIAVAFPRTIPAPSPADPSQLRLELRSVPEKVLGELADGSSSKNLSAFVGLPLWPVVSIVMPIRQWGPAEQSCEYSALPWLSELGPGEAVSLEGDGGEFGDLIHFGGEGPEETAQTGRFQREEEKETLFVTLPYYLIT